MSKIYKNVKDLIGNTPLLQSDKFKKSQGMKGNLFAKLEYFNPSGSVKDRAALYMIKDAEKKGLLNKDSIIIEPTSGNTGIGLAAIGAYLGYKVILVMPETMSMERRLLLKAYGAEIVLSSGAEGMAGSIALANEMASKYKNSFIPAQFDNQANAQAHFETTGPELWKQTDGKIDVFISGIGTGGTITGVGKFLKSKNPNIKIVAVEPTTSPVLTKGEKGAHKIQGIGAGFIPQVLDTKIYDEILMIDSDDAMETSREFAKTEGVLVGISSGAALKAAIILGKKEDYKDKNIVALLPDTGERYLSTELFAENK